MKKLCPLCGEKEMEQRSGAFHYDAGDCLDMIFENSTWVYVPRPLVMESSSGLDEKIENFQYEKEGLLLPGQIKKIREKRGLTQKKIAERPQ